MQVRKEPQGLHLALRQELAGILEAISMFPAFLDWELPEGLDPLLAIAEIKKVAEKKAAFEKELTAFLNVRDLFTPEKKGIPPSKSQLERQLREADPETKTEEKEALKKESLDLVYKHAPKWGVSESDLVLTNSKFFVLVQLEKFYLERIPEVLGIAKCAERKRLHEENNQAVISGADNTFPILVELFPSPKNGENISIYLKRMHNLGRMLGHIGSLSKETGDEASQLGYVLTSFIAAINQKTKELSKIVIPEHISLEALQQLCLNNKIPFDTKLSLDELKAKLVQEELIIIDSYQTLAILNAWNETKVEPEEKKPASNLENNKFDQFVACYWPALHNIKIFKEYEKVIEKLEKKDLEASLAAMISFGQFLMLVNPQDKLYELLAQSHFNGLCFSDNARQTLDALENYPHHLDGVGALYFKKGLDGFKTLLTGNIPQNNDLGARIAQQFHNIYNFNNANTNPVLMAIDWPKQGGSVRKAAGVIFAPVALVKNIVKLGAEVVPMIIEELGWSLFTSSRDLVSSSIDQWRVAPKITPKIFFSSLGGIVLGGIGSIIGGALFSAGWVTHGLTRLVLSPRNSARAAEQTAYKAVKWLSKTWLGKKLRLNNASAEGAAYAAGITSYVATAAVVTACPLAAPYVLPGAAAGGVGLLNTLGVALKGTGIGILKSIAAFFVTPYPVSAAAGVGIAATGKILDAAEDVSTVPPASVKPTPAPEPAKKEEQKPVNSASSSSGKQKPTAAAVPVNGHKGPTAASVNPPAAESKRKPAQGMNGHARSNGIANTTGLTKALNIPASALANGAKKKGVARSQSYSQGDNYKTPLLNGHPKSSDSPPEENGGISYTEKYTPPKPAAVRAVNNGPSVVGKRRR